MTHRTARATLLALSVFVTLAIAAPARATWSGILINTKTKEIAIGSATCLTNFDLNEGLPVVRVQVGAAAAQSRIDNLATNRMLIWNELANGTAPADMLPLLDAQDAFHQQRQYGIVDVLGRSVTFSGTGTGAYAGGVTGQVGDIVYAVQGNVLTGAPVIQMAEQAILNSTDDLPGMLMAMMQAARAMGGDGRCSCSNLAPTACGSPPAMFDKSAHIGFMIVSRRGDTDGVCDMDNGCANGDYFLNFNIAFQTMGDDDPVIQMQALFDAFRTAKIGVADANETTASFSVEPLLANGSDTTTMTISAVDWQGNMLGTGGATVTVQHEVDSTGSTSIGAVTDNGDGTYELTLTAGAIAGTDRFLVTIDDGVRPVILTPSQTLDIEALADGDFNGDGDVDLSDFAQFSLCFGGPNNPPAPSCPPGVDADFDNDGDVDLGDFATFSLNFTGPL